MALFPSLFPGGSSTTTPVLHFLSPLALNINVGFVFDHSLFISTPHQKLKTVSKSSTYSPNIDLTGYAIGTTLPLTKGAYLDAGVSMARIAGLPAQIQYLVNTMQTQYKDTIDFQNDWKLLTILIGANDLCVSCTGSNSSTPASFGANLRFDLFWVLFYHNC